MLIETFEAPLFGTNCWILAPAPKSECIIIDPGAPSVEAHVDEIIERLGLKPVAVIATHGHLDHTFSIRPIADGYGIPVKIHVNDRRALAHPEALHRSEFISSLGNLTFTEPAVVEELHHGDSFNLLDIEFTALHSPGHTAGSMMFRAEDILISGDVLFKGSIGRTDLPTGSHEQMLSTLRSRVLPLDDEIRVLPGHGDETTIGIERKNNPYLKELARG